MKIYKLYLDGDNYAVMAPVNDKFEYALWTNQSFKRINTTFKMVKVDSEARNLKLSIGDFAWLGLDFPFVLSDKAHELLKRFINEDEELRKVIISENKEHAYVYWPSKVIDCLDLEKSTINISPTGYKRLVKPVFNHTLLTKGLMFIVPQFMTSDLFVTEDVAEKILNSDLTGHILVDASIPRAR